MIEHPNPAHLRFLKKTMKLNVLAVGNRRNADKFQESFLMSAAAQETPPVRGKTYWITELVSEYSTEFPKIYRRRPDHWIAEIEVL